MERWWQNLSIRDQRVFIVGVLIVLLYLFYSWVWTPIMQQQAHLQQQWRAEQRTLNKMQALDQVLRQSQTSPTIKQASGLTMQQIESSLQRAEFPLDTVHLARAEKDLVRLKFSAVDFDRVIAWLQTLTSSYQITIQSVSVRYLGDPGMVALNLSFSL
jgi:general secretion pathway protein M